MGGDARPFADQGQVTVDRSCSLICGQIESMGEKLGRGSVLPLWIAWREVSADISCCNCTEHGISDGMQRHVGVRVPFQADLTGNRDPTQAEPASGTKPMDIDPLANPKASHQTTS
jgi:hypothetical protein